MKVELAPGARIDITEAMEYYAEQGGLQLASDFYGEFRSAAQRVQLNPYSFSVHIRNYRKVHLRRFPYNCLFRIVDDQTVRILTVRHDRRHPDYGTERD